MNASAFFSITVNGSRGTVRIASKLGVTFIVNPLRRISLSVPVALFSSVKLFSIASINRVSFVASAVKSIDGIEVNSIFTADDLPGYEIYDAHSCPLCQQGKPVDAIANGYGYSKL